MSAHLTPRNESFRAGLKRAEYVWPRLDRIHQLPRTERIGLIRKGLPGKAAREIAAGLGWPLQPLESLLKAETARRPRRLDAYRSDQLMGPCGIIDDVCRMVARSGDATEFYADLWPGMWLNTPCNALGGEIRGDLLDTNEGIACCARLSPGWSHLHTVEPATFPT